MTEEFRIDTKLPHIKIKNKKLLEQSTPFKLRLKKKKLSGINSRSLVNRQQVPAMSSIKLNMPEIFKTLSKQQQMIFILCLIKISWLMVLVPPYVISFLSAALHNISQQPLVKVFFFIFIFLSGVYFAAVAVVMLERCKKEKKENNKI